MTWNYDVEAAPKQTLLLASVKHTESSQVDLIVTFRYTSGVWALEPDWKAYAWIAVEAAPLPEDHAQEASEWTIETLRAHLLANGWKQKGDVPGLLESPTGMVARLSDDCPEFLRAQVIRDVLDYLKEDHAPPT